MKKGYPFAMEFKNIIKHLILTAFAIFGLYSIMANIHWIIAPIRRADMEIVQVMVLEKQSQKKGSSRGGGYTDYILKVESSNGCLCSGQGHVNAYMYQKTNQGDVINALCYNGTCYLNEDVRWQSDKHLIFYLTTFFYIFCGTYEAVCAYKWYDSRKKIS
jgi:hypothetical protein